MKYTQSIGDIKITIDDNRTENEKQNKPIEINVNGVKVLIEKNVQQKNVQQKNVQQKNVQQKNVQQKNVQQKNVQQKNVKQKNVKNNDNRDNLSQTTESSVVTRSPRVYKAIQTSRDADFVRADGPLPTSRDDDFVNVKQVFLEEFSCDFYWKDDDVNEFIGEYSNLYGDKAMIQFDRVTRNPLKYGCFWNAFYDSKVRNV